MRTFVALLIGHAMSQLGTHLTGFALGVTEYQRTGSVTLYSVVVLASMVPEILAAPFSGMLTDRWDRRLTLLVGHGGAAACVLAMAIALKMNALDLGIMIPMLMIKAVFESFMGPALGACTVALAPKEQLDRANGLTQLGNGIAQIAAPTVAGLLLPAVGLGNIFLLDIGTFVFAVVVLAFLRVPDVAAAVPADGPRGFLREAGAGFTYLKNRPGHMALILLGALASFFLGTAQILFSPLVLAFGSVRELGFVDSMGGIGLVVGSLVVSIWGAPRRKVRGLLAFTALQGAIMLVAVAKPSIVLAVIGSFGVLLTFPFTGACGQAIWQTTVPLEIQGRVLAVRSVASSISFALATALAGPLADGIFEPSMASTGWLASSVGAVLGVGPGRGVALLMAVFGVMIMATVPLARAYAPLMAFDANAMPSDDPSALGPSSRSAIVAES